MAKKADLKKITGLLNYLEEFKLLADREFKLAMKKAEKSSGIPWRQAFKKEIELVIKQIPN